MKYFWFDAPRPMTEAVTMTVIHDPRHGRLHSMWRPAIETSAPKMFRGLRTIEASLAHPRFQSLDLQSELKAGRPDELPHFRPKIAEIVEFALMEWLKSTDLAPGYADLDVHNHSAAERAARAGQTVELVSTPVAVPDVPPRRLLKLVRPVLGLPANAHVAMGNQYGAIDIVTRHSSLSLRMLGGGYERFIRPANQSGHKIQRALDAIGVDRVHQSFPIAIHTFRLELRTSQKRLTRFTRQASSERRWLDRLRGRLPIDFGFDRLIAHYAAPE